jgi:hypothetical protein
MAGSKSAFRNEFWLVFVVKLPLSLVNLGYAFAEHAKAINHRRSWTNWLDKRQE